MVVVVFRTLRVFVFLIVMMRILGKRQMGELELSELVVSVLTADLASAPLQDVNTPLLGGLVPILVLFSCELIVSDLTMRFIRLRTLLSGRPMLLIRNGKILQENLRRSRLTIDELMEELRARDVSDLSKIKYAVLETDGSLNALLYAAESPPSASDLGVQVAETGYPYVVIEAGRVLSENLRLSGHDEAWLASELKRRGVKTPREVYLLIAYDSGEVYYAQREDAHRAGGSSARKPGGGRRQAGRTAERRRADRR